MGKAFAWSEKFSVEVKTLDEHHKKLFELMDKLNTALLERRGREVVGEVLQALLDYTVYHFSEEEKLLEIAKADGIVAHKQLHRDFIDEIKKYKGKADQGMEAFITTTLSKTLNDWLVNHIGRVDKLYSESMHAAGIH